MLLLVSALLGLACLGLTVITAKQVFQRERALTELETAAIRYRADADERRLFAASREQLADASDVASSAVTLPTDISRATHQGIAAIPFGILEQIPATAETTKIVRGIHDEISRNVYSAISGTTRGIAGAIRGGLGAAPRPRPRPVTPPEIVEGRADRRLEQPVRREIEAASPLELPAAQPAPRRPRPRPRP